MAIRHRDIPVILVERVEAAHPEPALFEVSEIDDWPVEILALLGNDLLKPTNRATSVECDGCEWLCRKPVVVRKGTAANQLNAVILCDEQPALGHIPIAPERLQQFSLTFEGLRKHLLSLLVPDASAAHSLKSPGIGSIKGRNGNRRVYLQFVNGAVHLFVGQQDEPLVSLLKWNSGLIIDQGQLRRMANRKEHSRATSSRYLKNRSAQRKKAQQTRSRDVKIRQHGCTLMAAGKSATQAAAEISKMDFIRRPTGNCRAISPARIRRILADKA